jgi:hypothetical protein
MKRALKSPWIGIKIVQKGFRVKKFFVIHISKNASAGTLISDFALFPAE